MQRDHNRTPRLTEKHRASRLSPSVTTLLGQTWSPPGHHPHPGHHRPLCADLACWSPPPANSRRLLFLATTQILAFFNKCPFSPKTPSVRGLCQFTVLQTPSQRLTLPGLGRPRPLWAFTGPARHSQPEHSLGAFSSPASTGLPFRAYLHCPSLTEGFSVFQTNACTFNQLSFSSLAKFMASHFVTGISCPWGPLWTAMKSSASIRHPRP